MKHTLLLLSVICSQIGCSQNVSLQKKIQQLEQVKTMPYLPELSGDSLYWTVVKEKLNIVPFLIEKLNDTTMTVATVPNFGGNYTVADIVYQAMSEIIKDIPTLEFVIKSDNPAGGYWYYWDYVRGGYANRLTFQTKVKVWFEQNKLNLDWKEDTRTYRTAPDWKFPSDKHPAGGHYVLKQK